MIVTLIAVVVLLVFSSIGLWVVAWLGISILQELATRSNAIDGRVEDLETREDDNADLLSRLEDIAP